MDQQISSIQFKRAFNVKGSYDEAVKAAKKLDLKNGEPLIVSCYSTDALAELTTNPDKEADTFFMVIGRNLSSTVKSHIVLSFINTTINNITNQYQTVEEIYQESVNSYFSSEAGKTILETYTSGEANKVTGIVSEGYSSNEDNADRISDIETNTTTESGDTASISTMSQQQLNEYLINKITETQELVWDE